MDDFLDKLIELKCAKIDRAIKANELINVLKHNIKVMGKTIEELEYFRDISM